MMYDELIKRLRLAEAVLSRNKDLIALLSDAAAAIEQLSNAGSAYGRGWTLGYDAGRGESKPRWIPVTEALPEKYHQVLVYGLNGMQIDYYAGEKSIDGRPLFMISEAKVTHWQPLPEPPKEETE